MWVGRVRESGVQQMSPHINTQKYVETHRRAHTQYTIYTDICFTDNCRGACMHSNTHKHIHTHAHLIKHTRKHAHTGLTHSLALSHTQSLTRLVSPFGDHLDSVLSVATM